jgi:uncharacterized protein YrrD
MQIRANALVVGADGKDIGHVRRVVIDPRNDQIKDLVVRKGMLFTEDRVVPIELVAETTGEQVRLKINAKVAESLDLFEETFYVPVDGEGGEMPGRLPPTALAPAYYWYPPMIGYEPAAYSASIPPELMGYQLHKERHIPANTVALKEGATVKSRDDHHVGQVEQVLTAAGSAQATHIVVVEGVLNKTRKVLPLDWVAKIDEDEVTLEVSDEVMEKLPVYKH